MGPARALVAALGGRGTRFFDCSQDQPRLRAAADVFLQTAEAEDGAVALAAMAAGLPVLLSASDSVAALVTDGVQGWILPRLKAGEIAWRLRSLAEPRLRGAMAAQARALAEHCREHGSGRPAAARERVAERGSDGERARSATDRASYASATG
jgi:glycosyltransferase involved in cell wall biosynthesis